MKILHIISSPAGENSFSINLGNAIVDKLKSEKLDSIVITRNLAAQPLPHYDAVHQSTLYTPIEEQTQEQLEVTNRSNEAIAELLEADVVVIGVPMYNYGIPSTLKSWIDYIARPGKTFAYSEAGPEGLVKGKTAYLAISTGGIYTSGQMKTWDHTENYLKTLLGDFFGMDVKAIIVYEFTLFPFNF
tara:strand:+ start:2234 stop:2794 length:561 start_codon:yes stop_codon:yes gene_type:complete